MLKYESENLPDPLLTTPKEKTKSSVNKEHKKNNKIAIYCTDSKSDTNGQ